MLCFSSRAYKYLRNSNLLLLPSKPTLQNWISGFVCKPGVSDIYLNLVGKTLQGSETFARIAVISFDEMDILESIQYHTRNKCVYGPAKKVQMVMVRGLISKWKQVIYINFNQNMTKELFLQIVSKCEKVGIQIHAAAFDMGNHTFISQFKILQNVNFIPNPADPARSIFFFPDAPHLLKLIRNHCLDKGFTLPAGEGNTVSLGRDDFDKLIHQDGKEVKICPKLTADHINVTGSARQRVNTAAHLFSETTSKAFLYHFKDDFKIQSKFVLTVNNWFDTMNSCNKDSSSPCRSAFGVKLEKQTAALFEMKKAVEEMRFSNNVSKVTKIQFQKGILISISSMIGLYQQLQKQGVSYVLTRRLTQDCLENVFSKMRSLGNSHPGPADVLTKLKLLLVGVNAKNIVEKPVVEMIGDGEQFLTRKIAFSVNEDISNKVKPFINCPI